jgi:hypothetical protein
MTLAEKVFHELKILPEPYQAEVLNFVEFLRGKMKQHPEPSGALQTMLATEAVLRRDWDSPEEDATLS